MLTIKLLSMDFSGERLFDHGKKIISTDVLKNSKAVQI